MNEFLNYVYDKLTGYCVHIDMAYDGNWTIEVIDINKEPVVSVVTDDMWYAFAKAYIELKDYLLERNKTYLY